MINPEELNLSDHYDRFIEEYPDFSDRVALAGTLFSLDEVTEELNRRNKEHVLKKYLAYEELVAVVMSSHSPRHKFTSAMPTNQTNQA